MNPSEVLRRYWGYDSFRPMQEEIITSLLSGRDTVGLLPTGGGKSITFQVPALMMDGLTLVVSPLISLMKDQVDNLFDRGIRAVYFYAGMTRRETKLAMDRCRLGKVKLAYLSPERLSQTTFVNEMKQWKVSAIVVDEAHCISQWGYDFRPSYLKIADLREVFAGVPVLALTASATPEVVEDITDKLKLRNAARFAKSFDRDNISYIVRHDEHKEGRMLKVLAHTSGSTIVYVRSRKRCRELAELICGSGITAEYYHAGLSAEEKSDRQDRWKAGTVRVMVATNAFGMGIDKADVRVVVHYDPPSSIEEYYQEAGRAGRDGKASYAVLIASKSDKGLLTRRVTEAFPPREYILRVYELLCNFLDVIVGGGYNKVYDCDFNKFCILFKLQPAMTRSALAILTRSGYIEYSDESLTRSRIMVTVDKPEFYNLRLDAGTENIFQTILRMYTGLFSDYTPVDEGRIASQMGLSELDVTTALVTLSRMHVIHYIPRRVTPYVYFPTSRELPRYLVIPKAVYEDQRARCEARIEAMKRFAFSDGRCRAQMILEYFGEKETQDCGQCDVCREQKRKPSVMDDKSVRQVKETLRGYVSDCGRIGVAQLMEMYSGHRRIVEEALRQLLEERALIMEGTDVMTGS